MKSYRSQRLAELIKREIATMVLSDAADPRIKRMTITHVSITPDLKIARIFVTFPGNKNEVEESFQALLKASRFIRSHISQNIRIRYMPEIEFIYDTSLEKAYQVIDLINQIGRKNGS
jgi:ribosome-binding factor A